MASFVSHDTIHRPLATIKSTDLKKFYNILKRVLIVGFLLFIGLYFYTKNYWKNFASEKELSELISEIHQAESLPEKFYELYELENPNSLTYDLNKQIIIGILKSNINKPPSSQVALLTQLSWKNKNSLDRRSYKLREISFSWKIESETTQRECLNWIAANYDFLFKAVGIKQASIRYFEKEVSELNERELANLVIMMNNPMLYNPLRRKELLDKKVDKLLEKKNNCG